MDLDLVGAVADALEGELMSVAALFGDTVQLNPYLISIDWDLLVLNWIAHHDQFLFSFDFERRLVVLDDIFELLFHLHRFLETYFVCWDILVVQLFFDWAYVFLLVDTHVSLPDFCLQFERYFLFNLWFWDAVGLSHLEGVDFLDRAMLFSWKNCLLAPRLLDFCFATLYFSIVEMLRKMIFVIIDGSIWFGF